MLTGLFLIASTATAHETITNFGDHQVIVSGSHNIALTGALVDGFRDHEWTTACPKLVEYPVRSFNVHLQPTFNDVTQQWDVQSTVNLAWSMRHYPGQDDLLACLEDEADQWFAKQPLETMIAHKDSFYVDLTWTHADSVQHPRERYTLEREQEEFRAVR